MISTKIFKLFCVFFSVVLAVFPPASVFGEEAKQVSPDAIDLSLKTIDGEKINLKDYRGKKMVHLMFWATWCPHCLLEMPRLKELYEAVGDRPYEIFAVDVGSSDSLKRIRKIQKQYQIPCPIIFDKEGESPKQCKIISVPYNVVIDMNGVIKERYCEIPKDPVAYLNKLFPSQAQLQ